MRKITYKEMGRIEHANAKEIDLRVLSDKAFDIAADSSFTIMQDNDGVYYMSDGANDFTKVGGLKDLNEELEAYAE
jgi:hypothetical protein